MMGSIHIPQFPELTFDEFTHTYRLNELIIPSVTTVMKLLSDDFYRAVDPDVLERAARRGTAIHNAVENFAKFGIEAARRAAEAERERKLQEAAELETAGDKAGAESAMEEAMVMDEAATYTVPVTAKPKVSGVTASKDWEITDIDPKTVPLSLAGIELRPVDTAAVMRLIRASKGTIEIPGVTYKQVAKMSFRR